MPAQFAIWNQLWRKWQYWLIDNDVSALEACLAYPLSFSEIDRVVVGADSASQFSQIISAVSCLRPFDLPVLQCDDQNLINPARWS